MCIVKLLNERIDRYLRPMDSHLLLCSNPIVQNGEARIFPFRAVIFSGSLPMDEAKLGSV